MDQVPNTTKTNIYNINEFTDEELLNLLDLHSPSDRELEAKIIFFISKYRNTETEDGDKLATFFENVYERFFDNSDQEEGEEGEEGQEGQEGQEGDNKDPKNNNLRQKEGFTNATSSMLTDQTASASGSTSTPTPTSLVISNLKTGSSSDILPASILDIKLDNQNPILKQTIKRIITVDSSKRTKHTDYANTRAQTNTIIATSTDFTFLLSEPLKDVVSIKLYAVNIPYTWYTISNSYGSNFFYIKGNADGINNGNHDYKVEIPPGNYTTTELISQVNTSIQNLNNTYTDVDFGNSSITYNSTNVLSTINLDINNQYNESSYYLQFPTTDVNNTLTNFLGFDNNIYYPNNQYYPYKIISNTFLYNENTFTNVRIFTLDNTNNYFTIYKYIGPSEFDLNTSVIDLSFNVYFSLPVGFYTTVDLLVDMKNQIKSNQYLDATYSDLKIITPGITSSYGFNSYFELSLKLNRYTTKNTPYSNLAVVFPEETSTYTIWTGGLISSFKFKQNVQTINNIISVNTPPNYYNKYTITTSPYIKLQCTHSLYNSSANFYKFDISNATYNILSDYIGAINDSIVNVNNSTITPTNTNGDFYIPNTYAVIDNSNVFKIQFDLTKNINQKSFTTDLLGTFLYDLSFNRINDLSDNNLLASSFSYSPTYTFNENTVIAKFNSKLKNTTTIVDTEFGITPKPFLDDSYTDLSGTYLVSQSSNVGDNLGWKMFGDFNALNSWVSSYSGTGGYTQDAYDTTQSPSPYIGGGDAQHYWTTSVVSYGDIGGEWVQINLPYLLKMTSYTLLPRYDYNWQATFPNKFYVVGSIDALIWNFVDYQDMSNNINRGNTVTYNSVGDVFNPSGIYTFQPPGSGLLYFTTGVTSYYKYFRLIVTELGGGNSNAVCLAQMDISGVVVELSNTTNITPQNFTSANIIDSSYVDINSGPNNYGAKVLDISGTFVFTQSSYDAVYHSCWNMFNEFKPGKYWNCDVFNGINGYIQDPYDYNTGDFRGGGTAFYWTTSVVADPFYGNITSIAGEWVQVQLPYQILLTSYRLWPIMIYPGQTSWDVVFPNRFYLVGSNDNTTWHIVDYQNLNNDKNRGDTYTYTDDTGDYVFEAPGSGIFNFSATNSKYYFSYFRLIVINIRTGGSTTIGFSEIDINGYTLPTGSSTSDYYVKPSFSVVASPQAFVDEIITTNDGTYTCSESSYENDSKAYRMFNGFQPYDYWSSSSTYDAYGNYIGSVITNVITVVGGIPGEWVQIQLPYQLQITSYSLWPRLDNDWTQAYPANFYLVGSNDGVTWYNIDNRVLTTANFGDSFVYTDNVGENFRFNPPNSGILSFSVTNIAFYSYIRLIINKVAGSDPYNIHFSEMNINGVKFGIENATKTVAYPDLADYITNQFYNYTDPSGSNIFIGTTLTTTLGTNSTVDASLNVIINKSLSQDDYSIQFSDESQTSQGDYYVNTNSNSNFNYPNWLNGLGVSQNIHYLNTILNLIVPLASNTVVDFTTPIDYYDLSLSISPATLDTVLFPDTLPSYTIPKPSNSPYDIRVGGVTDNIEVNRLIQDISSQINTIPDLTGSYVVLRDLGNNYLTGIISIALKSHTYTLDASYSSWFLNLNVDATMINTSFSLNHVDNTSNLFYSGPSYSGIKGYTSITNPNNEIIITPDNNTISLIPYEEGVYSSNNTNAITITIPYDTTNNINQRTYTFQGLLDTINAQFAQNVEASHTTISTVSVDGNILVNFNVIVNKLYTAKDYYLTFYNNVDFLSFYNINNTLVNITWDTTLGWVLGFRVTPDYDLTPDTDYYSTHHISETDSVISINSSSTINTYLYNYFMICLDDYNLNRLNDGVVTITRPNNTVSLPSYVNSSNYVRDPVTGNVTYNTAVRDEYNLLTNNQLYSLTELINSANTNENPSLYSAQPFVKDVFGIVPLKLNGLNTSQTFSEFGGTLQNQERSYFGPVNITKMTVRLISDKGTLIDLNGQDWSFSLLVEQLYKKELTSK